MSRSSTKGNRNVGRVLSLFTDMGYLIDIVERRGRHLKQKDLYGLYDCVAVHPTNKPCLVQVTSNVPHTHLNYLDFASRFSNHFLVVQVIWVDRAGFVAYIYNQDNTKIIVDGRKMKVPEFTEQFRKVLL